ncbi:hypothetical protein SAMN05216226_101163 [Halovenus aranensis]|uniref:Uncharacterized protein n=1 Tax=Halovenus aranensis TaxID=890420 RepID=A0A1G8RWQ4_9EURY|nr:hypothetical protein [Halovenus aranensis]SDJ21359.1 hypothetical protein SAMN05216226_101163 [Halovenus aranensis]
MVNRRGQLLLTAAILVSLTIVASAVLLNDIHASADVKAQQERQSLEQTERDIEQLQDSLEELFMVNGSQQRLPYIEPGEEDAFAAAVKEYTEQYLNLSTRGSAQFVNVTLIDAKQNGGGVIWQNVTDTFPDGPIVQGDPANLTYMSYTFEDISGSFTIDLGRSSPLTIEIDSGEVNVDGATKCDGFTATAETPLKLTLSHGTGQISVGDTTCASLALGSTYYSSNKHVVFDDGGTVEGTFRIVAEGNSNFPTDKKNEKLYTASDVTLNPTFEITYEDPQVSYETNVTAYGGGS